ncbi:MAG: hypothetical protein GY865_19775 [candidate division Zixibacteria bacterium]|nr:hypothetical protein [candidate division Zixibacteria bacterium]
MLRKILIFSVAFILFAGLAADADNYKKYKISSNEENLLKISFSNSQTVLTLYDNQNSDNNKILMFNENDVDFKNDTVLIKGTAIFCSQGFFTPEGLFSIKDISKVKMEIDDDGKVEIFLTQKSKKASGFIRTKAKNRFGLNENIFIESDEFIRGSAISFWSDIKISGEVSGDVIALFGNVEIDDKAIIRGNVLSINGIVNHTKNSTVYGEIRSSNIKDKHRFTKTWRVNLNFKNLSSICRFNYNRIDGATPYFGYKYLNSDSTLPEVKAIVGYGFASERWRYEIGLKQYLLKNKSLTIGSSFYKRLASHDDWIISETENTLFALLATEDYKDYYEAKGGYLFAKYNFPFNIDFELGYQIENHKWLDANKNLWSLGGGSKRFRDNFSTVRQSFYYTNSQYITNRMDFKSLILKLDYNPEGNKNYPINSFFSFAANLEITPYRWKSYSRYTLFRYTAEAVRFQKLNLNSGMIFSLNYGRIGGSRKFVLSEIPIHKMFFLGGLGTLHGYNHKEFAGTEFWLGSIEYKIKFPAASWDTWLFYEVGQIGQSSNLSEAEVKNSLGIGITFNNLIRLNVAKRLDRSDDTMTLTVRLKHQF